MRKILLFIGTLVLSLSVIANPGEENKKVSNSVESFKIIVIDAKTEEPIPAAKVKIDQKDLEAYTDFDGFIELSDLTVGEYNIEISFTSYQKQHLVAFQLDNSNKELVVKLIP